MRANHGQSLIPDQQQLPIPMNLGIIFQMKILEEKYKNLYREKISFFIFYSFKETKLEGGIEYNEANCIHDHVSPDDIHYIKEKSLDEQQDWRKVVTIIETNGGNYNHYIHNFMDGKGLHFFLPVMLILREPDHLYYWF